MGSEKVYFDGQAVLSYIAGLEERVFKTPWSYSAVLASAQLSCNRIYIAYETDGGGIGCSLYMEYRGGADDIGGYLICNIMGDESELLRIAVSPNFRRRGFGRRLIEHYLADTICVKYFLEVRETNTAARRLYEQEGYRPLGIRKKYYSNPVCDAIIYGIDRKNDK